MNNYKHIEMFKLIDDIYPNGIVGGFKAKNPSLYEEFKQIAKKEGVTLKQFFTMNGYEYYRTDLAEIYKKDKKELKELFPNKVISNLHKKDSKLYFKILNHSKIEYNSIEEYFEALGFSYDKYNSSVAFKEIEKELKSIFPDKTVSKLSMKNQDLYSRIYKIAKKRDLSVYEYLEEIGFNVKN